MYYIIVFIIFQWFDGWLKYWMQASYIQNNVAEKMWLFFIMICIMLYFKGRSTAKDDCK